MGNFLAGIQYPILAGAGALIGVFLGTPLIAGLALIWPALWAWVFAPCAIGAVAGLIFAATLK